MKVHQLATRVDPGRSTNLRGRRPPNTPARDEGQQGFDAHFERARLEARGPKISNHAWQRIQQRSISMTDAEHQRLGEAMQQLADKGARDALLMRADAAFVVNVPNRTVVTAIDHQEMQQRVFTQIDSALLL